MAYFGVSEQAWDNLLIDIPVNTYISREGDTINNVLTWDGSGFQYSWPLLSVDEWQLNSDMKSALYNALFTFLDKANRTGFSGIFSASAISINQYSGKIGVKAYQNQTGIQGKFGLFDSVNGQGEVSKRYYSVDNGSMILVNSKGSGYLLKFLHTSDEGRAGKYFEELYSRIKLPIRQINKSLPLPD